MKSEKKEKKEKKRKEKTKRRRRDHMGNQEVHHLSPKLPTSNALQDRHGFFDLSLLSFLCAAPDLHISNSPTFCDVNALLWTYCRKALV